MDLEFSLFALVRPVAPLFDDLQEDDNLNESKSFEGDDVTHNLLSLFIQYSMEQQVNGAMALGSLALIAAVALSSQNRD